MNENKNETKDTSFDFAKKCISAWTVLSVKDITQCFDRITLMGYLTINEVNYLEKNSVPINDYLAKLLNVKKQGVKNLLYKNVVKPEMVRNALLLMCDKGGIFEPIDCN